MKSLTVCIVTWNSSEHIARCLEYLNNQSYSDYELLIIDNNSVDDTREIIKECAPNAKLIHSEKNLGFCGGHNLGINVSNTKYYMPFNPDIVAEKEFLEQMVRSIEGTNDIGSVSGKLLRYDPIKEQKTNVIDSTGIIFKRNRRSLDRGAEEIDKGQYNEMEYVFGASGAAPIYKREMLEDIKINNEYFLEYFFAYREDVDLAWRAQLKGWKCLFNPAARSYHVRHNTPEKRALMSASINMHSVKNRIIMLIQNESKRGIILDGWNFIIYDLMIIIYVLFREHSSIPALTFILKSRKKILGVRKVIQSSKSTKSKEIIKWFGRINAEVYKG
ncbi:glycosyltransferase family 2 protein [Terribacillus sp. JSM ZJ617]|uniref:glycosyltransferase family 2 protein n=1 Tax=Terribacillus sp. JSM ZJ617 TaxID=3342119 RepID=UPI0035A94F30